MSQEQQTTETETEAVKTVTVIVVSLNGSRVEHEIAVGTKIKDFAESINVELSQIIIGELATINPDRIMLDTDRIYVQAPDVDGGL